MKGCTLLNFFSTGSRAPEPIPRAISKPTKAKKHPAPKTRVHSVGRPLKRPSVQLEKSVHIEKLKKKAKQNCLGSLAVDADARRKWQGNVRLFECNM